jgi:energy-coupling factor transporter ATP-binding protein EcfA2
MISSIQIDGYRGLEHLEMSGLGRVNLLVGANNSGKTSVLEAIELLASKASPVTIWQILWRRGERITFTVPAGASQAQGQRLVMEADVCHMFTGHDVRPGARFSLLAKNQSPSGSITVEVVELSAKERVEVAGTPEDPGGIGSRYALRITGSPLPPNPRIMLSQAGGISPEAIDFGQRRQAVELPPSQFITTDSISPDQLMAFWSRVSLKPEEELVLDALRVLDKDIERIALSSPATPYYYSPNQQRGGFMVKRKSAEQPIPIGSMGDGMWRMLAMSVAITLCKGGTLLVDEIDTGLHHTTMSSMWKLIYNAAKRFDVQVFATTHSYDCIYSLAQLAEESDPAHPISVQRVESGRDRTVPFSEQELTIAAEREIEVR